MSSGLTELKCPTCGAIIRDVDPVLESIVRCDACQKSFVLRRRTSGAVAIPSPSSSALSLRVTAVKGNVTASGRLASVYPPAYSSQAQSLAATASLDAKLDQSEATDEQLLHETGSYSSQQIIALAYDRPERVALGPAPVLLLYRRLKIMTMGLVGLMVLWTVWRFVHLSTVSLVPSMIGSLAKKQGMPWVENSGFQVVSIVLQSLVQILLAGCGLWASDGVRRSDDRARWLAWRSAATDASLDEPPGRKLSLIVVLMLGALLLFMGGVIAQLGAGGAGWMQPICSGGKAVGAGVFLGLMGWLSIDLRGFLWRMGQSGRALSLRKRGDEVGLPPPVRVQGFERSNSAFLMLVSLVLGTISFATVFWAGRAGANGAAFSEGGWSAWALAVGMVMGLLGGAYVLYRLAVLWNELVHGWELAVRSIGKARVQFGKRATSIFCTAAYSFCAIIFMLMIPAVKTVGDSSVAAMVLSLCWPFATILLFVWTAAVKMDSFRVVSATVAVAGSRLSVSERATGRRRGTLILVGALVGLAVVEFLWRIYVLNIQQHQIDAVASGQLAAHLLESVLCASTSLLLVCWSALLILDLERAAANLETCREVSD